VIMYGGFVGPSYDVIRPPTVRGIPGVHMHAMALDNLLTFGNAYKADTTRIFGTDWPASSVNLAFMLLAYLLAVVHDARTNLDRPGFDPIRAALTVTAFVFYPLFCWFSFSVLNLAPSNWVGAALITVTLPAVWRSLVMKVFWIIVGAIRWLPL